MNARRDGYSELTRRRRAEDGPLAAAYRLVETESAGYHARTVRNVRDSDATLICNLGELEGGSLATLRMARRHAQLVRVVQLDSQLDDTQIAGLRAWLADAAVGILNVAGPRESKRPGIHVATYAMLDDLFAR